MMLRFVRFLAKCARKLGRRRDRKRISHDQLFKAELKMAEYKGGSFSHISRLLGQMKWKMDDLKGLYDYSKEPFATVHDMGGDCDDFSVLWKELIDKKENECRMFTVISKGWQGHVMLAVKTKEGYFYIMSNTNYSRKSAKSFDEVMRVAANQFFKKVRYIIVYDDNDYPRKRISKD